MLKLGDVFVNITYRSEWRTAFVIAIDHGEIAKRPHMGDKSRPEPRAAGAIMPRCFITEAGRPRLDLEDQLGASVKYFRNRLDHPRRMLPPPLNG